jgi:hypothetical protein
MSKKHNPKSPKHDTDMFSVPNSTLKTLKVARERIKKADENHLDQARLKIQTIEEYYKEFGIKKDPYGPAESHAGEYPDLFQIILKKDEKDDVMSITPGLEAHSSVRLYASLLTASIKTKSKTKEMKLEKKSEEENKIDV